MSSGKPHCTLMLATGAEMEQFRAKLESFIKPTVGAELEVTVSQTEHGNATRLICRVNCSAWRP